MNSTNASPPKTHSIAAALAALPHNERRAILGNISEEALADLAHDWRFWGRADQFAPVGAWTTWLVLAGRGWGKTRTGAEWIRGEIEAGRARRVALVAETANDARDVMVEGPSGILNVGAPDRRPRYEPSKRRLTWPSGAIATLFNATEPDQLRGPQFDAAWCDELAKWRYARETWDQLQFGLRLGVYPRQIVTTTPRPIALIKDMLADSATHVTRGCTLDNAANLAPTFLAQTIEKYGGTRLGRQELDAEILDDVPGALWTRAAFERAGFRLRAAPELARVAVAVDPSGAGGPGGEANAIGIVVAGKGIDGRFYVVADRSCKLSPNGRGRRAVEAYHEFSADRLVAEGNFGGAMVEHVIRSVDADVAYRAVTAARGKVARAEPIAALYE
ncbi:MAG TPA: terminase family protein, partial [Beijerinckiaceae bacterium]|nr:terminase family protein [Beijerinckiaceae bacterium]